MPARWRSRAGRAEEQPSAPACRCRTERRDSTNRLIRLLIVDDHPVVRDGLSGIFAGDPDFEVIGQAANGVEAVRQAEELQADVVLMDLRMPEMGGVEAIKLLRKRTPSVHVIVLTTYDTDNDVLSAIEAGATGYLLKDAPREELIRAVRAAHRGESVLSPSVASVDGTCPAAGHRCDQPA